VTTTVGIVGAGVAGIGAAYALRDAGADVQILEKSRGVAGRAATRRRHGCVYDHGANYVKDPDPRTEALVPDLGTEGLVDIEEPVWTFDAAGDVSRGYEEEAHKWTWSEGMTQLGKRILARTDADLRTQTRVTELSRRDERWTLADADGGDHGPFDSLVVTPPAPQTAALLRASTREDDRLRTVADAADRVTYRTIRTVVLHYSFRETFPWYALVNTDKEHAVGWLSREECKEGHVPDGESLLVVQMSPEWSTERYDEPLETAAPDVAERVARLLDDDRYRDYDWTDDQKWRLALPNEGADGEAVRAAEEVGLYVAGDWVAGEGRVHSALWNGYDVGERVADVVG
jgi:hypothetical protein